MSAPVAELPSGVIPTPRQQQEPKGAARKIVNGGYNVWKRIIGYNDTEAHRLGIPVVSSTDYIREQLSDPGRKASEYLEGLFPIRRWIGSYNLQWLVGDLIAGFTVALVLVPQSMSYAGLANLKPEYGLYSSFVGVMIYAWFATSKDVTIGPVAVMSLQTGNVVARVMAKTGNEWQAAVIASALAFICGVIVFGIGILRIGWLVEFIPAPAVSGFMTGSALTIITGQLPKLMGVKTIPTNGNPAYKIIIDFLKHLPNTKLDAAFGLTALFFLYAVRAFFNWVPKRYPHLARPAFFASVTRHAFVIIVLTIASRLWIGNHYTYAQKKKYPISLLLDVPRGFKHMGQPDLNTKLLSDLASEIPVSTIVLLLEHIAIAKSFGRLNNYKINPNQELVAMGVTNLVGPCFGAYAATGSFSRTALKNRAGVRTPLAGIFTGIIVLLALYALTGTFYWIPQAALSAVIIHAVGDLIASPSQVYKFWLVNPLEMLIWWAAVLVTVFTNVENGVYTSVAASLALLLVRIARPHGNWLGLVKVSHTDNASIYSRRSSVVTAGRPDRVVFVPLDDKDGLRDPSIRVEQPPPGVLIYRFQDAFLYPNASHIADIIIDQVKKTTRPLNPIKFAKRGDYPWNEPGPRQPWVQNIVNRFQAKKAARNHQEFDPVAEANKEDVRPILRAIIFDLSTVSNVDTTSIQTLVDVRTAVDRYIGAPVEYHFANILSPWIRRALLAGGFGTGTPARIVTEIAPVVAQLGAEDEQRREAVANVLRARDEANRRQQSGKASSTSSHSDDIEKGTADTPSDKDVEGGLSAGDDDDEDLDLAAPILWGKDLTPRFHLDLTSALEAATQAPELR